ncbi:proline dehydrogenase 2, mitochondrial-like [Nicotiana tabacum]|uniref:Proline dehydrogenase n=2 Tax=Nicotiana TaxID=4085 RepID=Q8W415_TOBAC|nr:proline dehydrogenase 2, mitochondrial-like [Nicotiana tabacum]XP_009794535.1 PREDICTED: proline dehydrogenase 2, mitochondrial-like [Nicotiana sylvestris]XP_016452822.1 PREDICTED: proline dehydrogenase 2, mitochondrial-like [Nicotiana tabacum]BAB83948.1 CIG1 [Nicotiana tabacum]
MANKVVCPKAFRDLRSFVRCLNTAPTVPPMNFTGAYDATTVTTPALIPTDQVITADKKVINFEDVKELFTGVSTLKLIRSTLTLQMAATEPMVDVGIWVMNSKLMHMPIVKEVILGFVKGTFYEHFCAGKDLIEVRRTVTKLSDVGLKGMLDYGVEHATENESCDQSMKVFLQTAESTKSLPSSSVSFVVVKITAICTPKLLKRMSDLLRWEHKNPSFNLPWKQKSLPLFSDSSPFYHTPQKPEPLTVEEEHDLQLAHERLMTICKKCLELDVDLLIDAEDTAIQPAIDYFAYSAAIKYHKDDDPMIFGTIQAYLKDSKERMVIAKKAAEKMGVPMGFKLVRGAYMSSERELASRLGVQSPIHDSIEQTHDCFNSCAEFMLDEISNGSGAVVLATHNIDSGKLAASKAIDLGIRKDSQKLQFAQLYGMAEGLSFGLRNAGFQVSKYLPFGPVEQVMPYLIRRAEENRGLLSTSAFDRQLMRKELTRRFKVATS